MITINPANLVIVILTCPFLFVQETFPALCSWLITKACTRWCLYLWNTRRISLPRLKILT